jgi:F-type H+-transporting ATPase subunit b
MLAVLLLGVIPIRTRAQVAPAKPAAATTTEQPAGKQPSAQGAEQESKESGGESGEDALRHAPPVRWIAKHTGMSVDQAFWLSMVLNFAIVAFAIFSFARKRLPGLFNSRTEMIQKSIEEARKTSEDARRRLNEVEGRLSRLDVEIAEMRGQAEENARAEELRVLATVEDERRRIVESAEQEIQTIANAARRDLKAYAGALAVELAEKKIRVGKEADQSLVREFTAQLGKDGN